MVSLTMMARLLEAVRPDARLVLVGDPDQLASVEAGAVLGDLAAAGGRAEPALQDALAACGAFRVDRPVPASGTAGTPAPAEPGPPVVVRNGVVRLERNWRFGGTIADFAAAVQDDDADTAVALLRRGAADLSFVDGDAAEIEPSRLDTFRQDVVRAAVDVIGAADAGDSARALRVLDDHRVLCAHRRGPHGVTRWTAEIERWIGTERPGFAAEAPGTRVVRCWSPRTTTTWGCSTATPGSWSGPRPGGARCSPGTTPRSRSNRPGSVVSVPSTR